MVDVFGSASFCLGGRSTDLFDGGKLLGCGAHVMAFGFDGCDFVAKCLSLL